MDLSIRGHIISNFKDDNEDNLRKAIDESIKENDEVTLPGMGVFFELLWDNADEETKNTILKLVKEGINK